MIKRKETGDLIVISGPSGCGKDTIVNEFMKKREHVSLSVSYTTRKKRDYEIEGKDYYFVSMDEFISKIKNDDFLEFAYVHEKDYYGTPKREVYDKLNEGTDVILVIDIQGALQIKELYPSTIGIFILPPSMKELKLRLEKRGSETKESMLQRFKSIYKEVNEISKYNYVVVNDEVESATEKIRCILESEKCRVDRIEELDLNSIEEVMHETLVDFNE